MHMRTKKWAKPELAVCPYFTDEAEKHRGHWRELFEKDQPLHLELGCGKGVSTAAMVYDNKDVNFIAMDITCNVLGDTRRNIAKTYGDEPVKNAMITRYNIEDIRKVFAPEDRVERIYINFCNPWTKRKKHEKRRLTHSRQLMLYRDFLTDEGEIWFKTDSDLLFQDSLTYFKESGFEITYCTYDLHNSDFTGFTPMTEHEKMFTDEGIPTKFLIAKKLPDEMIPTCETVEKSE